MHLCVIVCLKTYRCSEDCRQGSHYDHSEQSNKRFMFPQLRMFINYSIDNSLNLDKLKIKLSQERMYKEYCVLTNVSIPKKNNIRKNSTAHRCGIGNKLIASG